MEEIVARHCLEIYFIANDFVMIGMNPKRSLLNRLPQKEERFIFTALALGDNDRSLRGNLLWIEAAVQHPV